MSAQPGGMTFLPPYIKRTPPFVKPEVYDLRLQYVLTTLKKKCPDRPCPNKCQNLLKFGSEIQSGCRDAHLKVEHPICRRYVGQRRENREKSSVFSSRESLLAQPKQFRLDTRSVEDAGLFGCARGYQMSCSKVDASIMHYMRNSVQHRDT
jgi:hypothetical protein